MRIDVIVPSVGESITKGMLGAWIVKNGDRVRAGEDLFELETEKATVSVPSPADGSLAILVAAGSEVSIGAIVGYIETEAGAVKEEVTQKPIERVVEKKPDERNAETAPGEKVTSDSVKQAKDILSPSVRRIVSEKKIDTGAIEGTGKDGRLTKGDVLDASENKVDAHTIAKRVPMSQIRKTIAKRLVQSRAEAAHLTTFNEVDMGAVMELRKENGEEFNSRYRIKLGFMSFFVKAVIEALREFPMVGGRIEGDEIVIPDFYDIGVAVSTERGLLVPVIRNADKLTFPEIERTISDLAIRARDKKLGLPELQGGIFTITNGGIFGSLLSTPIPNYPQSAILGMHTIQNRPVVRDDAIVARPMMYVALTYDHRLIDGREAVLFLIRIKEHVEDPKRLLIGM
jgi:2-oxoglutarate dehydrogenase E2 component (dihydrolipoamide succinyltransferase)